MDQRKWITNLTGRRGSDAPGRRSETEMDAWVYRLKEAYDAGFYRTESARDAQTAFPWQGKTCKDCPFWRYELCQVFAERRNAMAHTCVYFDPGNQEEGRGIIAERERRGYADWNDWLRNRHETL